MFLLRPRPNSDEALSSWRQRASLKNGISFFPRAPGELQRSDTDLKPADLTMSWLANQNDLSVREIEQHTLRALDGKVLRFRGGASVPKWVLPLRYSRRDSLGGIPFCPLCLSEDKEPYFRLRWRMCLTSVCSKHRVRLAQGCERCKSASWPAASTQARLFRGPCGVLHECPVCGFDLRATRTVDHELETLPLTGEFHEGLVQLSTGNLFTAVEFASAAWCVAQLFIRNRSASKIHSERPRIRELIHSLSLTKARSIEFVPFELRAQLTSEVASLFTNWPSSILAFARDCKLSAEHFSIDRKELPRWFEVAVRLPLRRQVRGVGLIDVQTAIDQVALEGRRVTKRAVADVLGLSGSSVLDASLGRRSKASSSELDLFLLSLKAYVEAGHARKSSGEVILRDAVVVLMALRLRSNLRTVVAMSYPDVLHELSENRDNACSRPVDLRIGKLLDTFSSRYLKCTLKLSQKRAARAGSFFVCFRGGSVMHRGAQELLRACMQSLDSRLSRSVSVFWN